MTALFVITLFVIVTLTSSRVYGWVHRSEMSGVDADLVARHNVSQAALAQAQDVLARAEEVGR